MSQPSDKWYVLLITSLAPFLTAFMGSSVNIALPTIGMEFGTSAVALGWIATSYLLAAAVGLVPLGRLADLHGRKRVFTLGIAVYMVSSLLCALAPSNTLLLLFRVIQGTGGAMLVGTSMAILMAAFPHNERGKALGWNVAAVYSGLAIGPFLGGILTQHLGWRSLFIANVPLGALILALACWKIEKDRPASRGARFDLVEALAYGASLVALMTGFSTLPALRGVFLLLAGIAGLVSFAVWELRAESPLLDLRLFRRNRTLTLSNLAALINYSATAGVGFLLSLYLQYNRRFDPQTAGLVLVSQPIIQTLFSPLAGRISDRIQPRIVASIGMSMTVAGLSLLSFLGPRTPLFLIVLNLAWMGLSFALFSSPNTNAVMSAVDEHLYGIVSGTLATMRATGQMVSMGIAMLLFSVFIGNATITEANAGEFLTAARVAFALFAFLCLGGVFASLSRGDLTNRSPSR